jgi:hypothetical protein
LHGNPAGNISGKLRERKDNSNRKQEMKIYKLIAPHTKGAIYQTKQKCYNNITFNQGRGISLFRALNYILNPTN